MYVSSPSSFITHKSIHTRYSDIKTLQKNMLERQNIISVTQMLIWSSHRRVPVDFFSGWYSAEHRPIRLTFRLAVIILYHYRSRKNALANPENLTIFEALRLVPLCLKCLNTAFLTDLKTTWRLLIINSDLKRMSDAVLQSVLYVACLLYTSDAADE